MAKRYKKKSKTPKITLGIVIVVVILAIAYFVMPQAIKDSIKDFITPPETQTIVETPLSEGELKIHFVDVGQGDSTIIQLPDGKNMIIDGGDRSEEHYLNIKNRATTLGIKKFDYLILTHSDADHVGGMDSVLEDFDVIDFYVPKTTRTNHPTKAYGDFLDLMDAEIKENKGTVNYSIVGMKIAGEGYSFDFYLPNDLVYGALPDGKLNAHQINSVSPIIVLSFDGRKVMFTGDTNLENEAVFNNEYKGRADLDVDILKVAHHGSREATTEAFLKITKPEYAVIMCGEGNSYGHPDAETVARLNNAKSEIYRTDTQGTIILTLDAKGDDDASIKFEMLKAA